MAETTVREQLPLPPEQAFAIFVEQIDTWWPRQGIFPYSFAPKETRPHHIRYEPREGGRLYETFADGTELVIGEITRYEPPHRLEHSWRDPSWPAATQVLMTFEPDGDGGTTVTQIQDGFAAAGMAEMAPYYEIGNRQTLAAFVAHCRATHELATLEGK